MLTEHDIEDLLLPVSEDKPCGDDLEYDAAFLTLQTAAQGQPEQQFGDTIIPAVEPDWPDIARQARELLKRSKDLRPAMLLLRAATRTQGLPGFTAGSRLVQQLLDRYWSDIHPALDADDDNDPTMRLNALAAFADETTLLRDLYGAIVGNAPGVGPIRVRDIAVARNVLAASADSLAAATVQGGLEHLQTERPDTADKLRAITPVIAALDETLGSRANLPAAIDFAKLRTIGHALSQAAAGIAGAAPEDALGQDTGQDVHPEGDQAAAAQRSRASAGEVHSRQDALTALDKVIRYLQQAEPGNPAPLLIERAKRLIGVSFLEIMADLAPNALDTIEVVTGKRPESES